MMNLQCMIIFAYFFLFVGNVQLTSMFLSTKPAAVKPVVKTPGTAKPAINKSPSTNSLNDILAKQKTMTSKKNSNLSKQEIAKKQKLENALDKDGKYLKSIEAKEAITSDALNKRSAQIKNAAAEKKQIEIRDKTLQLKKAITPEALQQQAEQIKSAAAAQKIAMNQIPENGTAPIKDYTVVLRENGLQKVPEAMLQAAAKNIVDIKADAGNRGVGLLLTVGSNVLSGGLAKARDSKKVSPMEIKKDPNTLAWENPTNGVPESNIYKSLKIVQDIYNKPFKPMTEKEAPYVKALSENHPHVNQRLLLDYVREFLKDPTKQKYEQKPADGFFGRAGRTVNDLNRPIKIKPVELLQDLTMLFDEHGILKNDISPLQEQYLALNTLETVNAKYLSPRTLAKARPDFIPSANTIPKLSSTHQVGLQFGNNVSRIVSGVHENVSSVKNSSFVGNNASPTLSKMSVIISEDIPMVKDMSSEKGNAQNLLNIVPKNSKTWVSYFGFASPTTDALIAPEKAIKDFYCNKNIENSSVNLQKAFIELNKDILALGKRTDANQAIYDSAELASKSIKEQIEHELLKKLVHTGLPIDEALKAHKNKVVEIGIELQARNQSKDPIQKIVDTLYHDVYTKAENLLLDVQRKRTDNNNIDIAVARKNRLSGNQTSDQFIVWSEVVNQFDTKKAATEMQQRKADLLWQSVNPIDTALIELKNKAVAKTGTEKNSIFRQIEDLERMYKEQLKPESGVTKKQAIENLIEGLNKVSTGQSLDNKISKVDNREVKPEVKQEIDTYVSIIEKLADKIVEAQKYTNALVPEKSKNFNENIAMLEKLQQDVNQNNLKEKVAELKKALETAEKAAAKSATTGAEKDAEAVKTGKNIKVPDITTDVEFRAYCKQMIQELQARKAQLAWQKAGTQVVKGWTKLKQGEKLSGVGNILGAVPKGAIALHGILGESIMNSLAVVGIDENSLEQKTKDKITAYTQRTIYLLLLFGPLGAGVYGSLSAEQKLQMQKAILKAFWGDVVATIIADTTGASEDVAATGSVQEILLSAGLNKTTGSIGTSGSKDYYNPNPSAAEYKSSLERLQEKLAKQQADSAMAAG